MLMFSGKTSFWVKKVFLVKRHFQWSMKINFVEKNMLQKKNHGQRNCFGEKDGGEKNFGQKNFGHFLGKRNG